MACRRLPGLLTAAALAGCGQLRAPAPLAPSPAAPASAIPAWIADLGSEEPALRRRASERLLAEGERALPALEAAAEGRTALAARARRLAGRIAADLVRQAREADDRLLASPPPALSRLADGHWAMVAGGRLAATGATREEVLGKAGDAAGARHRYLWRAGEGVAARDVELGSLSPGDLGVPVREALGPGVPEVGAEGEGLRAALGGSSPEDWQEAAVALEESDAIRLGLARWEIPGRVTVRSRVGAGILGRAWRARATACSADGARHCDVAVWVLPDRDVLLEEREPPPLDPAALPGARR